MEIQIGENAGKIWASLGSKGPQTIASLSWETKLTASEVDRAVGWLAREGKVDLGPDKRLFLRT